VEHCSARKLSAIVCSSAKQELSAKDNGWRFEPRRIGPKSGRRFSDNPMRKQSWTA
jgi:hypothetical protein